MAIVHIILLGASLFLNAAQSSEGKGINVGLVRQLAKMVKIDQDLRNEVIKASSIQNNPEISALIHRLETIDRANTNQMRRSSKPMAGPR